MVLEPRILLDASLVDTTSIEADPEQPTDLQFDVPGTRVSDPRVLDPRLSDPQEAPQRMITPDLPTIRNWLDTANTHNARLSIVVKLWDAQPEDRISLAETYTSSSVLRDTWDDARGELRLEPRAGAASPAVGEAFLDALQALQLEASGAEDVSTREVWVFPTLAGASEVAYRVERSSGMVRHYVLDASLESYADARKTAEQQRFFGADGYLGHFSSDAEKSVYGSMAQGRPLWLGLSDRENVGVWKVSSGPKEGQIFWQETDAGVGIYGSGARSSGLPDSGSPGSGWGDADWEKLWGTNDFPRRVSLGSGFPVALLDGDDAEVSSSEDSKGARIVHHDLLLSSGGFFAREVRVPKTSSTEGGRSDADAGDTAEVAPEKEVLVRKTRASLSRQTRQSPPSVPPVLDVTGLTRVGVRMHQRLVLTDAHLSATDADTVLAGGAVDPARITFRITAITGGRLQRLSSSWGTWQDMTPETGEAYYAFTLADLQAGNVAFLAGDGLQAGEGDRIAFKVQAVDDDGNLSDVTPVDAEILFAPSVAIAPGSRGLLNADGLLTPKDATLIAWKQSATTHEGTLHVIVKLFDKQDGDVLSLKAGYDASKITSSDWDWTKGELDLEIDGTATIAHIKAALELLEFKNVLPVSENTRKVWVFPVIPDVESLRYRVDEEAGLVRHYRLSDTGTSIARTLLQAEDIANNLFGKQGYLGLSLSDAEKEIYKAFAKEVYDAGRWGIFITYKHLHLAISDSVEEGKWLITAGPRKGQLFWDHSTTSYGPGAAGSGWSAQDDFWSTGQPDDAGGADYARFEGGSDNWKLVDVGGGSSRYIVHHDLRLWDGSILARLVEIKEVSKEASPNPVLEVDFSKAKTTARRHLILTEDHISVDDPDTRDPLDNAKVDAEKIELRITNIQGGTLHERADASSPWTRISPLATHLKFTLAQLQGELISLRPNAAGTLTFDIQAADDKANLSDSSALIPGIQPASISISVVALETVAAGEEVSINGDGALTPDDVTLQTWLTANDRLKIFVVLGKGKEGIFNPIAGVVQERLSVGTHSVPRSKIAVKWDAENWRLSLEGTTRARRADFQEVLNALQLQTVHFGQVSHRTILVRPELSGDVLKPEFHVREVQVSASAPNPILEVAFDRLRVDSERRLVLTEKHIAAYDPGTTDASSVWLRVTGLTGGELQRRSSSSESDWTKIVANPSEAYLEFTLAQLRAGRIALLPGDGRASGEGTKVVFRVQAAGDGPNLSDSDPSTSDPDPLDVEILIRSSAEVFAGYPSLLDADGVLTPDDATLIAWKQTAITHSTPLYVIVKLFEGETTDALSLRSGYNESKITALWNEMKGELSIRFDNTTTVQEMKTALEFLEFESVLSDSASTRKVWIFPTLSGVESLRYRLDASAGLIRYYLHYDVAQRFEDASASALESILFGKHGYLGVFTSQAEKDIWRTIIVEDDTYLHLALTDTETEGKWLITAGPRKGQLFWDHTTDPKVYGSGAAGSGWSVQDDFWSSGEPDDEDGQDYAMVTGNEVEDWSDEATTSMIHYDLLLEEGEIFTRLVEVAESPPNPILRVGFSEVRATSLRPLILTEHHLSVKDIDTRDPLDPTKVDASRIKFRITNIANGTLKRLRGAPSAWENIVGAQEFSLADVQDGLIAFVPDAGASTLTFDIQAADDKANLSDSDPYDDEDDADPTSVSVLVVVPKKVVVGEEVRINEDGFLTPNDDTLDEWLTADDTLRIFVVLQGGKSGIFTPRGGVVPEHLSVGSSHGVASSKIAVSWDPDEWKLSLQGTTSARRADFQKVLDALRLQTVPFGQVSHRTISVRPDIAADISKKEFYVREVEVSASLFLSNPLLDVDFDRLHVDSGQRLVLTQEHILVYDPDTPNALDISFRVSGLTGGTLQSSTSGSWKNIDLTPGTQYREFTLADLKAGQVAFLPGDGLASGEGKKIVFRIQAADDTENLSDFDPRTPEKDPVGAEILVVIAVKATAGFRGLINADGVLSPDEATLGVWKQSATTHRGTLHVVVRLGDMQDGDILSLRTGYDATKIKTADWDATKKELSIEFDNAATPSEMKTVLGFLEFESVLSDSASTRKVWVFPTLSGAGSLPYRLDASAGLVRYYFYDSRGRSFSAASTAASGRSFFGKSGYLGVYTSDAERDIYKVLRQHDMHLAMSDDSQAGTTEGKWLITAGPRKGQLFWDNTNNRFGHGAASSGWNHKTDFWNPGEPTNWMNAAHYALMRSSGLVGDGRGDVSMRSVSHHDLWLTEGEIFARLVEVAESPPNPVLRVDFSEVRATAQRPLILTQDHISVEDPDTLDPLDPTKVDASRIKFRITNIANGTLKRLTGAPSAWENIVGAQEFSLADVQGGLIAFFPDAGASTLTFDIQAADDKANLSDSDPYDSEDDADPTSVSVSVVALETVAAGEEVSINGDGALTPDVDTLDAWLVADDSLQIFVVLGEGKEGIITPAAGLVQERLSVGTHGVSDSKIAVKWDAENGRLSLQGTTSARRADFQAVLNALQLRTVHFGQVSHRTISVGPELPGDISKKEFHVREVQVSASAPNPILEVAFDGLRVDSERRLVLTEKHISVYDPDTTDASSVWLRVTGLTGGELPGGELQRRSTSSATDWTKIVAGGKAYLEFTLAQLRAGRIAILAGDGLASGEGKKIVFRIQAADAADGTANLSDFDPLTPDKDPVGADIVVVIMAKATAGFRGLINADGALSPDEATLTAWKQSATTHSGTLHVIVRLGKMQDGDILSLRTGYDTTKIKTADWDARKKELDIEFYDAATTSEIKTALGFLEFESVRSGSASVRQVWVFPTLSGVSGFGYRVDESAGLVRYYLHDDEDRWFPDADTEASESSLFGKQGYLGAFTSQEERDIWNTLFTSDTWVRLALTDAATEGKWLITAGPRKGQLFWDHTSKQYGPGAAGSGWSKQNDFWSKSW